MIALYIFVGIVATVTLFILIIELSGPPGDNAIEQVQRNKKLKIRHLLEKQEELQNIISKLEAVVETKDDYISKLELVVNWKAPDPIEQDRVMYEVLEAFEKEQNAKEE